MCVGTHSNVVPWSLWHTRHDHTSERLVRVLGEEIRVVGSICSSLLAVVGPGSGNWWLLLLLLEILLLNMIDEIERSLIAKVDLLQWLIDDMHFLLLLLLLLLLGTQELSH